MLKNIQVLLISLLMAGNVACVEEAQSPIAPTGPKKVETPSEKGHLDLMALTYSGKDPFGRNCLLHVSLIEEEHEEEGEHHHELVVKLGYNIHGESPLDSIVELRRYDLNTNTFYAADSVKANTVPVLVSAILKDEDQEVNFNDLVKYENSGELVQSLRIDLQDIDVELFEAALEEVIEDSSALNANKEALNQLQRAVLKISHGGHYDALACSNFSVTTVQEVEFELDKDHDDGDHDHDHGHE